MWIHLIGIDIPHITFVVSADYIIFHFILYNVDITIANLGEACHLFQQLPSKHMTRMLTNKQGNVHLCQITEKYSTACIDVSVFYDNMRFFYKQMPMFDNFDSTAFTILAMFLMISSLKMMHIAVG